MSLDLYMVIKSCEHCGHVEETESLNMTYNVSPMWREIFPDANEMCDIDNLTGRDSEKILLTAFKVLINNPKVFIELEPANGWGTYNDFMNFIERLYNLSIRYPDGIWKSHR